MFKPWMFLTLNSNCSESERWYMCVLVMVLLILRQICMIYERKRLCICQLLQVHTSSFEINYSEGWFGHLVIVWKSDCTILCKSRHLTSGQFFMCLVIILWLWHQMVYLFPKVITENCSHQWWQETVHFSPASPAPYGAYQDSEECGVG